MKLDKYLRIKTLLFLFLTNSIVGQIHKLKRVDEFLIDDNLQILLPPRSSNDEVTENIRFGYDISAALYSHDLVRRAMINSQNEWFNRQYGLLEEEIESQLNTQFPNFGEAQKAFYKNLEKGNVLRNVRTPINKYNNRVKAKTKVKRKYVSDYNLLEFRANEISAGVMNSQYGHLQYHSTPLSDLRSLSQIESLKASDLNTLKDNEWKLYNDTKIFGYLEYDINRGLIANNLNHAILLELLQKQLQHYNSFNRWEQLDLMQLYLNNVRTLPPLVLQPIEAWDYGSTDFIENFALNNRPGAMSIFHPNYLSFHISQALSNNPSTPSHVIRDRIRDLYNTNLQVAIENLLNSVDTNTMLAETAITGLGTRNNAFLDARPTLKARVLEYLIANESSQYSQNAVNYLLNQYQDGGNFDVNSDLYISAPNALFQDSNNKDRALSIIPNSQAIVEGVTNFGNVLSALFSDGENPAFEGYIIRDMFLKNGISVPNFIANDWLGSGFNFEMNQNGTQINISYNNFNGTTLFNNGINTSGYLNNLIQNINTQLTLDDRNKRFLFSNPKIAIEYKEYLDNNNSANSKLLLKELEKVFLIDCYGATSNTLGLSGVRLLAYYERAKNNLKELHPDWTDSKIRNEVLLSIFQTGLDVVGLIPGVGEIADLTNGVIYFVRGDRTNAALSFAATVPFLGWGATGAKIAIKAVVVRGGTVVTAALPFIFKSNGLIDFGSRGALKKVISTLADEEAHHILPWAKRFNEVIQKAANAGFHINDHLNGIALKKFRALTGNGIHGNHPKYDDVVEHLLNKFSRDFPNSTPQQAKDYLSQQLIPELTSWINRAKDSGLNLNEYFKQIVKPFYGI